MCGANWRAALDDIPRRRPIQRTTLLHRNGAVRRGTLGRPGMKQSRLAACVAPMPGRGRTSLRPRLPGRGRRGRLSLDYSRGGFWRASAEGAQVGRPSSMPEPSGCDKGAHPFSPSLAGTPRNKFEDGRGRRLACFASLQESSEKQEGTPASVSLVVRSKKRLSGRPTVPPRRQICPQDHTTCHSGRGDPVL